VFHGPERATRLPGGAQAGARPDPVDLVARRILGVAGRHAPGGSIIASSSLPPANVNPFYVRRSVELVALYKRRKMDERVAEGKRSAFENWIDTFLEPYPRVEELYFVSSTPFFRAAAKGMRKLIADHGASWGAPHTTALLAARTRRWRA